MLQKINNPLDRCDLKFDKDSGSFKGYASVFNGTDSDNDTILPGAFADTLKNRSRPPHMFINHRSFDIPVGDWLALKEDSVGLAAEGKVDLVHRDGPSLYSAMKNQRMDGLSIGFRIPVGGAEERDDGPGRIIAKLNLVEISVVTRPADDDARISVVKSEIETINNIRDAELFLRDSGEFSRSTAVCFVSRLRDLAQRDFESELKQEIAELKSKISRDHTGSLVKFINDL